MIGLKVFLFLLMNGLKMSDVELFNMVCSVSPSVGILIVWVKMSARIDILNARLSDLSVRLSNLEKIMRGEK